MSLRMAHRFARSARCKYRLCGFTHSLEEESLPQEGVLHARRWNDESHVSRNPPGIEIFFGQQYTAAQHARIMKYVAYECCPLYQWVNLYLWFIESHSRMVTPRGINAKMWNRWGYTACGFAAEQAALELVPGVGSCARNRTHFASVLRQKDAPIHLGSCVDAISENACCTSVFVYNACGLAAQQAATPSRGYFGL